MVRACRLRVMALAALGCLALSCSTGKSGSTSVRVSASVDTVIEGPNGVIVRIPAGALTSDTTIVVSAAPASRRPGDAIPVAPGVRLGPSGQTFVLPVEIEIPIDPDALPAGSSMGDVVVKRAEAHDAVFVPLPTRRRGAASVSTITEHFSDFVASVPGTDASVSACGDAMCLGAESCSTCPIDCGLCVGANACGNLACESGETCSSCDYDCGACPADAGVDAGPVDAGPIYSTTSALGLTWIQDPFPAPMTFDEASAFCGGLFANGASDWRVPTRLEHVAMLDFSFGDPAFDVSALHVTMGDFFWTSTDFAGTPTTSGWIVSSNGNVAQGAKTTTASAFCVRDSGAAPTRYAFTDNGDGTVTDQSTGLIWQQAASLTTRDQATSATFCTTVSVGTLTSGWRAPDARELMLLVDDRRTAPSIDPVGFPSGSATTFWSSTPVAGAPTLGIAVNFSTGASQNSGNVAPLLVRCVH